MFDKKAVQMVACGSFHVLAMVSPSLTSNSIETYSWGSCICGQLGHGDFQVKTCINVQCSVVQCGVVQCSAVRCAKGSINLLTCDVVMHDICVEVCCGGL